MFDTSWDIWDMLFCVIIIDPKNIPNCIIQKYMQNIW